MIAAVNLAAEASGVFPGQRLADARALTLALEVAEHDPAGDAKALERLAAWCGRYTPSVACDGRDGLFLDVTGCAHLFGGEEAMLADLSARVAAMGFAVRAGLAETPGAAWAVARFAESAIVPAGEAAEALADLPIAGLRLAPATAGELARLGLKRIGQLYGFPRAPLAARFGDEVARRLDQALGRDDEPISPRHPAPPYRVRLALPEPIVAVEDIARGVRRLLHGLCQRLQRDQRGLRRLELVLFRVDGTFARAHLGTARPVRDVDHLMRLLSEHLGRLDPGFGVETMVLSAPVTEPLPPEEIGLDLPGAESSSREDAALAALVDRLGNRLGGRGVFRLVARESHVPERAVAAVPALAETSGRCWRCNRARPLRLFAPPQPVEAVAPVPDDPPVMFRWRDLNHRVLAAQGPERIAGEWWRDGMTLRDYYRVEDAEGRRFWLYREGLYRPEAPPRWFLHGVFA